MALTNEQYNVIKRYYDEKRLRHQSEADLRKEEIYKKIPAYRELELKAIDLSMARGKSLLKSTANSNSASEYHQKIQEIKEEKAKLLAQNGYPADYPDIRYDCSKCGDTGYVNNQKCSCFLKKQIEVIYDYSQMLELIKTDNFDNLSRRFYEGDSLERFDNAVDSCKNFIKNFDSDYHNLLFYGTVGTGKSFLSGCVAREIMNKGFSVIYVSAIQLFQTISNHIYNTDKEIFIQLTNTLFNCDLLIIDDLGTESVNDFVRSRLFDIVNERKLRKKPIIISTNLTLEELRVNYSDRVFSRIYSDYELLNITVHKDIRLQKGLEESD